MELNNKIMAIEEEVKLIKTEIKTVLVDLRATMNSYENPFVNSGPPVKKAAVDTGIAVNQNIEESVPANEPVNEPANEPIEHYKPQAAAVPANEPPEQYKPQAAAVPTNEPPEPYKNRQEMAPKNNFSALEKGEVNISGDIDNIYLNKLAGGTNIDIITLTRLMNWTDNALYTIGKDKLNAILELYDSTGRLPKETKDVIIRIEVFSTANSAPADKEAEMKDCIHVLYQLDKIVSGESQAPILLPEEESELEECLKV